MKKHFVIWLPLLLVAASRLTAQTSLYVAADGSGQFKSVQAAIMSVPAGSVDNPVLIHIKPGVYNEAIYIQHEKQFFRLIGGDPEKTILTYNFYASMPGPDGKPIGTFRTASATIDADDFVAENITFENSAGPIGQALAIRVDGDRAIFRNCRFLGWQDTILLNRGRQYFTNCYIAGHVDFIFGAATAFFEKCHINCLKNGYITAASTPSDQPFGFVFSDCKITSANPEVRTYLGRPWRIHASTIFLNTEMSDIVRPEGWNDWRKPETHQTARYAEYHSIGPGANPKARVPWAKQLIKSEAEAITVKTVLGDTDGWDATAEASNPIEATTATASLKTDIVYGKAGGQNLLLDASVADGNGPFPVVIIVHGGGWCMGTKEGNITTVCKPLSDAHFTWFSINYRLAPTNRWPACFDDVQTAIRWVKKHAAEFKGDPNRIALLGYSAGGHLVSLAATLARKDTRVQAVVGCAPPTDLVTEAKRRGSLGKWSSMENLVGRDSLDEKTLDELAEMSPINHIKPGLPPFLLIQGDADKTVPYEQTLNFRSKLEAAGVPCKLITVPGAQHHIKDWDKFDPTWKAQMIAWLEQTPGKTE